MSDLTNRAKRKLCEETGEDKALIRIEEYLTDLCVTDVVAEKILDESKTLKGCMEKVKSKARDQAANGVAMLEDEEVFGIVREYYSIDIAGRESRKHSRVNVLDLL